MCFRKYNVFFFREWCVLCMMNCYTREFTPLRPKVIKRVFLDMKLKKFVKMSCHGGGAVPASPPPPFCTPLTRADRSLVFILDGNSEIDAHVRRISVVFLSVKGIWLDREQSQIPKDLFSFMRVRHVLNNHLLLVPWTGEFNWNVELQLVSNSRGEPSAWKSSPHPSHFPRQKINFIQISLFYRLAPGKWWER